MNVARQSIAPGSLVLVATPIGNLGDLSPRALDVLQRADLVCCEDTRHTGMLLQRSGVRAARLAVLNEHTEADRVSEVLAVLGGGGVVAVVTDAGTPGISDPGALLVRAIIDAGHRVSAVPGPTAFTTALVISGFDTSRFVVEGFLPRSGTDRRARLAEVAAERRTIVLYEAPHRLVRTVADLCAVCGPDRRVALARELTKLHEEVWRGTLAEAVQHLADAPPRGEYAVVLEGAAPAAEVDDATLVRRLGELVAGGSTRSDAVATVMHEFGVARRRAYPLSLTMAASSPDDHPNR